MGPTTIVRRRRAGTSPRVTGTPEPLATPIPVTPMGGAPGSQGATRGSGATIRLVCTRGRFLLSLSIPLLRPPSSLASHTPHRSTSRVPQVGRDKNPPTDPGGASENPTVYDDTYDHGWTFHRGTSCYERASACGSGCQWGKGYLCNPGSTPLFVCGIRDLPEPPRGLG